jgi:DNA-binding NarL/FixJ family response regulator
MAERPDICLLDISMPGDGIAAAARICAALPDTSVVMLTVADDDAHLFDALRAGAIGYLLKDIDPEHLSRALHGVLVGEAALPRALVTRVIDQLLHQGRRRVLVDGRAASLTSREWEVLELLRAGASTAEMGERLFISPATVRSHVASVLHKLHLPDRAAALGLLKET